MKAFTEKEIEIMIKMFHENYSYKDIGNELDRAGHVISRKLKKLGLVRTITTKQCPECDKQFTPGVNNAHKQTYCSERCKHKAGRRNRYVEPEPIIKECINCTETFRAKHSNNTLCSDECREENYKKRYNRNRTIKFYKYKCIECGKRGYSKRKKGYCSDKCSDRAYSKKKSIKQRRLKKCAYCNKWHYKNRVFCSGECSNRNMKRNRALIKEKRMQRARQNGQFDADIDIYKLIERDGEQCYLCGDAVSFDCHFNDPKYPTIEHVLAISNGGTHSWDNVKVACRDCNNKKGIKLLEEVS